jgi:hypothetical protein
MDYTLESFNVRHEPTGMTLKVEVLADYDYGPPEQEHDGHGVITEYDWDANDTDELIEREGWDEEEQSTPYAMETIARYKMMEQITTDSRHGRYKKYYDVWETLKIARAQGWCGPDATDEELLKAVMKDCEYIQGWYNDDWCWAYVAVTPLDAEGEPLDEHRQTLGGIEYGYGEPDEQDKHIMSITDELVRQALDEYNAALRCADPKQLELLPVWQGLRGAITRV